MGPSRLSTASHPSLGVDSAHWSCRGALFTLDSGVNLHSNCEEGQDCHLISQMGKLRPREGKRATYSYNATRQMYPLKQQQQRSRTPMYKHWSEGPPGP